MIALFQACSEFQIMFANLFKITEQKTGVLQLLEVSAGEKISQTPGS